MGKKRFRKRTSVSIVNIADEDFGRFGLYTTFIYIHLSADAPPQALMISSEDLDAAYRKVCICLYYLQQSVDSLRSLFVIFTVRVGAGGNAEEVRGRVEREEGC